MRCEEQCIDFLKQFGLFTETSAAYTDKKNKFHDKRNAKDQFITVWKRSVNYVVNRDSRNSN